MPVLPDCVDNNIATKELKPIGVLYRRSLLSSIKGQVWKQNICDTPLKFIIRENDIDEGLNMSIACTGSTDESWKLVVARLLIKFQHNEQIVTKSIGEREFNASDDKAEVVLTREEITRLVGAVDGRGVKSLNVSMTLEWIEHVGMSHFRSVRYDFRRRTENSSMVIVIENERFFVNLGYLAQLSQFFADLSRTTDSMEKDEATGLWLLKLEDVKASEFEELLKLLYPTGDDITVSSDKIEFVAKLSERFKCPVVQANCAEDMINMENISAAKLLAICEKYNMEWNVEKLINSLSIKQTNNMVTSPEFHSLSLKTLKLLVIRMANAEDDVKTARTANSPSDTSVSISIPFSSEDESESESDN